MEWAKAKNLEILLLVIVNLVLFGINVINGNGYILTGGEQSSIIALLKNNNIELKGSLPREYSPMRNLLIKPVEIDIERLKASLFAEGEEVSRSVEIGKVTLKSDYSVLTVENNVIKYNASNGRTFLSEPVSSYDLDSVRRYAQNIVNKIDYNFANLTLDTVTEKTDIIKLTYYDVYKGWKVLDSCVKVIITKELDISIEIVVYKSHSFVEFEREICSSDEALLTLIPVLKNKKEPVIEKIDIVYGVEPNKFEMNTEIKSIPYYRIFITELEKPYLINAYINQIKLEKEQYFHE